MSYFLAHAVNFVVASAFLPAVGFPFVYHGMTHGGWRRTLVGRQTMEIGVVTMLLMFLATAKAVLGEDWPGRDVLRPVIYLITSLALWHRVVVFYQVQQHPDKYPLMFDPNNQYKDKEHI